MSNLNRKWTDGMLRTEDWWAVWLGLIMFFAGLLTIWGIDLVGWMAKTKTWEWTNLTSDFSWDKLLKPSTKTYSGISPLTSFFVTYAVFTTLTCIGAYFQGLNVKKFFLGFTIIFFITWLCWIVGHEAHFKSVDAIVKGKNYFDIALIPHTLKITNFGDKKILDFLNLEIDIVAKYVENFSTPHSQDV